MDFASQNLTAGQLNAIVKGLGGEEGTMRFLRGELIVTVPNPPVFSVFKTIRIGTGLKNADDFRKAIKKAGMKIGDWGNDILGKPAFSVASEETEVDLVVVTVEELGFKRGTARRDIIERALCLGLELCPSEAGPQLRLQYVDQPKREWLLVAMESIAVSDCYPYVFSVEHSDGGLWLHGYDGYPDTVWHAGTRFVFVRPRK